MKWNSKLPTVALVIVSLWPSTQAQTLQRGTPVISERGLHHRSWEWIEQQLSPSGEVISSETRGYVELATGLNRQTADGSWVETDPAIEISPDRQHGLVRNLQYQVILSADLAAFNSLDVSLPGGKRLTGHFWGLAYFDGNNSVLISEPKAVNGEITGRDRNQLVFRDAMTDFAVDVYYVVERDRFSQNLILRQRLPSPLEFGLTENATLAILTEFTEAPSVQRRALGHAAGIADEHLSLGIMEFGPGRGLSVGEGATSQVQSIRHSWETFEGGRQCLVEQIPWRELEPGIRGLPPANADVIRRWKDKSINQQAKAKRSALPARRLARVNSSGKAVEMAVNATTPSWHASKGYLLDFELLTTSTNIVLAGDKTFYVSGPYNLAGTNNRLESCVIKFSPTNGAKLNITGSLICDTASLRPSLLTARDDHDAGEPIGSATLSGYYATNALAFANGGSDLRNIRISHAYTGISYDNASGDEHTNMHVQFVNCLRGITGGNGRTVRLRNVLMSSVRTNFDTAGAFTARCEHLTAGSFDSLTNGTVSVYLTNSILVGNSTFIYPTNDSQNVAAYTNSTGVFQQAGAGSYYLHGASGVLTTSS